MWFGEAERRRELAEEQTDELAGDSLHTKLAPNDSKHLTRNLRSTRMDRRSLPLCLSLFCRRGDSNDVLPAKAQTGAEFAALKQLDKVDTLSQQQRSADTGLAR